MSWENYENFFRSFKMKNFEFQCGYYDDYFIVFCFNGTFKGFGIGDSNKLFVDILKTGSESIRAGTNR